MSVATDKLKATRKRTMTTAQKLIAEVTTDCLCTNEDGTLMEDNCYGECYEWQKEVVFYVLGQWQKDNNIDDNDHILIDGSGMGWQRKAGFKWTTMDKLHGALALDRGDFRIEWYLENNILTARRYSHDEPTGTGLFHFSHYKPCEKCGVPVVNILRDETLTVCTNCDF
jgi:hypothetical protein